MKQKLYELETAVLAGTDFIRISKSMILNLAKVERFAPSFSGRFEAICKTGRSRDLPSVCSRCEKRGWGCEVRR